MSAKKCKLQPIHPGEILKEEFLKPMGISINKLSRDLLVPPNRISRIVRGKRAVTADTALRLGKYFGVSPELWTGLQADYALRLLKQSQWLRIEPRIRRSPAKDWIGGMQGSAEIVGDILSPIVLPNHKAGTVRTRG